MISHPSRCDEEYGARMTHGLGNGVRELAASGDD
jgi:hypothetical protein